MSNCGWIWQCLPASPAPQVPGQLRFALCCALAFDPVRGGPALYSSLEARWRVQFEANTSPIPYHAAKRKEPGLRPMGTDATLTSKGQTTIPKEIRDNLKMKEGDRMTFTLLPNGTVLLRVKNKSVLDVAGRLHKKDRESLPVEDLSR